MENRYQDVKNYSTDEIVAAITKNDPSELLYVVVGAALYHEDLEFVQQVCLRLARHDHFNVRGNAVVGFGHLARRFGTLDALSVKPILEAALNDASEYVRGQAVSAGQDCRFFLGWTIVGLSD